MTVTQAYERILNHLSLSNTKDEEHSCMVKGHEYFCSGPLVKCECGAEFWSLNGLFHRLDGPAVVMADRKEWWRLGKLHRIDGPAIEVEDGTKEWWVDGVRHRMMGPAVEVPYGTKMWYCHGQLSRIDGPAVITEKDYQWWYLGVEYENLMAFIDILSSKGIMTKEEAVFLKLTYYGDKDGSN